MTNSKTPKPNKPTPDFPLFPHATKRWAKKIKGKLHYFGPWDDPDAALDLYVAQKDDLFAGRAAKPGTQKSTKRPVSGKPGKSDETVDGNGQPTPKRVRQSSPTREGRLKPKKPYKDFPLFPHACGQWAKKIKGKLYYFGPWEDHQGSLDKYLAQKDDLFAGRAPRDVTADGCTVRKLVNSFLASKKQLVQSGELAQRSFDDYYRECERVIDVFGRHRMVEDLTPKDFERLRAEMTKTLGPVSLGNAINRARILFKYAYDQFLVDKPVRYGQGFKRPSRAVLRKERNKKGPRMFEAKQIRDLLDAATRPMKAMILLGINCGFGNSDCAALPRNVLDLKKGWIDYPRPKTGIHRRCPLWPETVAAMKDVLIHTPEPESEGVADLVFLTKHGKSWSDGRRVPITHEFTKLLNQLDIKRPGLNFYALRHTFQTIGEQRQDLVAVQSIMGHAPASNDMSSVYREEVDDDRLQAVTGHIRNWLFGS